MNNKSSSKLESLRNQLLPSFVDVLEETKTKALEYTPTGEDTVRENSHLPREVLSQPKDSH